MFAKNRNLYLARMESFTPDWSAFPILDESTWYQLIEKELNGKPLQGLDWDIDTDLTGRPVYHRPDEHYGGPLTAGRGSADWLITDWLESGQPVQAHALALQALTGGAQALIFDGVDPGDVAPLTDGIWMDMARIFWGLAPGVAATQFADALSSIAGTRISDAPTGIPLGGFITPTSIDDHLMMQQRFSQWQSVIARTGPALQATQELTALLHTVRDWLDHPMATRDQAEGVIVRMEIGPNYLVEIARIRAWHILWGHLMRSYGWPEHIPCRILASISPDPDQAWETTYIASSTRALSAILGGVDYLAIRPPAIERPEFAHRIARNIQHLMKEESHLHRVIDPLAGSYAIETITLQLAERAWFGLTS